MSVHGGGSFFCVCVSVSFRFLSLATIYVRPVFFLSYLNVALNIQHMLITFFETIHHSTVVPIRGFLSPFRPGSRDTNDTVTQSLIAESKHRHFVINTLLYLWLEFLGFGNYHSNAFFGIYSKCVPEKFCS